MGNLFDLWGEEWVWLFILTPTFFLLGAYLTYKTGMVQCRFIKEMLGSFFEKRLNSVGISPLQAFSLSLAVHIGSSNVMGVVFAISIGGPGAVFWMWVIAFFSMALAFVENILTQVYKVKIDDMYQGGPAYYISKGLQSPKLAAIFAVVLIFVFGLLLNIIQANIIIDMISVTYNIDSPYWTLIILMVLTAIVAFGGLHRISHVTEIIVPLVLLLYLCVITFIVVMNLSSVPAILKLIVSSAFGTQEMVTGAVASAMVQGLKRGLFFNGIGMGSASLAGATANTRHPAKQGLLQSFAVFVDTFFVSGITAFVILQSGLYGYGIPNSILMVQAAMSPHMGHFTPYYVSTVLLLTSFSAIIANYYYGETNIRYFSRRKGILWVYRILALSMLALGSLIDIGTLWRIIILCVGSMTLVNMIVIFLLSGVAFKVWDHYLQQKRAGITPYFYAEDFPELTGIECWQKPKVLKKRSLEDPYFKAMPR